MTITSATNKVISSGNGSQTSFAFNFVGVAASDIQVTFTNSSGVSTVLTRGPGATQYQISLNAPAAGQLWGVGGTVTYNPNGTPIPTGSTLTIARIVPYTQATSLQNQASYGQYAQSAETAIDLLEMQIQQIAESQTRVISAPIVDPSAISLTLPPAAQRANLALMFDGQGNVIAGSVPSSGTISSAMQPVVNAATIAAGRTALGLGAMALEGIGAGLQDDGSGNARVNFPITSDASNQTVTSAFHLKARAATGPITYTLPPSSSLWNGFGFWVFAYSGAVTFAPNVADNFKGQPSGVSLAIQANSVAFVTTDATGVWYADVSLAPTSQPPPSPQGRLTLTSGTPVLTSNVSGATTIYYTPYIGAQVPLWNGTNFIATTFAEISQALNDTTHSPAAAVANSVYDLFVWNNNGTVTLSRGPAWAGANSRGYSLNRVSGTLVNGPAITNGPQAGYGTYVGTIATNGSATVDWVNGGSAPGGSAGSFQVWNMYNRREVKTTVQDSNTSWTYAGHNVWREVEGTTGNQVGFVVGLVEDAVSALYSVAGGTNSSTGACGVGLNSSSSPSGSIGVFNATVTVTGVGAYNGYPGLGSNALAALEFTATGNTTFNGAGEQGLVVSLVQ